MCLITSRCNQGATAEADTFEEQQQVKCPQLGSSSWSGYSCRVASYPDLLTPAFVTCCTIMGESLEKLITCKDIRGRWVGMWRSGTFLLYSCKAAFWTQETSPRLADVDCSVILQSLFVIGSAITCSLLKMHCLIWGFSLHVFGNRCWFFVLNYQCCASDFDACSEGF